MVAVETVSTHIVTNRVQLQFYKEFDRKSDDDCCTENTSLSMGNWKEYVKFEF